MNIQGFGMVAGMDEFTADEMREIMEAAECKANEIKARKIVQAVQAVNDALAELAELDKMLDDYRREW